MKELKETHQKGLLSIENPGEILTMDYHNVDFGIQIARDGRVWICINGIAFLRFKPEGMGYGEVLPHSNAIIIAGERKTAMSRMAEQETSENNKEKSGFDGVELSKHCAKCGHPIIRGATPYMTLDDKYYHEWCDPGGDKQ